jgi:phosphoglycolate phosphatase
MDGTLINSGTIISDTINHVRINMGLSKMDSKLLLDNINNPYVNPAEFFYETKEFTPRHSSLFEEYYAANCMDSIYIYDGIKELLEKLSDAKYKMSIATNASNKFARDAIKYLEIEHHFSYIIGYDDVKEAKPEPEMLLKTLDDLDICHTNSILVGDSKKDLFSAQKANIKCHLVNWGFSDHKDQGFDNTIDLYNTIVS